MERLLKAEEKKRHIEVKKQKKEFLQGGCGAFKSMKTTSAAVLRRNHQGFAEDKTLNTEKGVKNMGNVIRKSLKKKKSSTNSVSAAVIPAENDTTAVMSTAAEGMTSDQNNQLMSDGEEQKSEVIAAPLFRKRGRNMRDMMNQIVEKEAKKEEEMKELGINVQDEKSNSSGSDSNPSADEMEVRKYFCN